MSGVLIKRGHLDRDREKGHVEVERCVYKPRDTQDCQPPPDMGKACHRRQGTSPAATLISDLRPPELGGDTSVVSAARGATERAGWALSARLPLFGWNWSPDSLVGGDRGGPQCRAQSKAT